MKKEIKGVPENPDTSIQISSTSDCSKTIKNYRCKWKPGIGNEFMTSFPEPSIDSLSNNIHNSSLSDITSEKMDSLISELSDLFIKTAQSIGLFKEYKNQNSKYIRKHPNKPWWNND